MKSLKSSCSSLGFVCFLCLAATVVGLSGQESARVFSESEKRHWAFQPIAASEPPDVADGEGWVRNNIDRFVLAELRKRNLAPAPSAEKPAFIRRATLDLWGLPPSPDEVAAFVADDSPNAHGKLIDRLLASPRYGERWGRHWLDLARYAESEGFKADETRPYAWRYRDYVIDAFNSDKPYDRFLQEQIAGDELWPEDPQAWVATAFNRHYPDESNARNLMQRRQEILNDITDTVGAVFTGVTYACARCHDHKFDPISQADYYRLQAFFANTAAADAVKLAPAAQLREYEVQLAFWEDKTRVIREEMAVLEAPKRREIIQDFVEKYPEEIQAALSKPEAERTPFECQMAAKANLYLKPESHQYIAPTKTVVGRLKGDEKKRWEELDRQLAAYADLHPGELALATAMTDVGVAAPKTHLLRRGNWDAPVEEIAPGFLSVIDPAPARIEPSSHGRTTGRRAALAKLLTDPANPLPARVLVNRLWQYHFGQGIVRTASDFGIKGDRPSHPELLDWLAAEFVKTGWSLKSMHRLIMDSSVYRQSSEASADVLAADPENRWLARFSRQRLEGETIRDAMLAVSGRLNERMGGPSVFPELPPGMVSRGGWPVTKEPEERDRRSIYVFVRRNTRYPLFETFDMPDTHESCARRNITTSPLQALTLLNSQLTLDWAKSFAGRVLKASDASAAARIDAAFEMAYARRPDAVERRIVTRFLAEHAAVLEERRAAGEALSMPEPAPDGVTEAEAATWVDVCHMLLNANEFVYRN